MTFAAALVAVRADVPVDVERDEARRAAAEELADRVYQEAQPSLVVRVVNWVSERLGDLLGMVAAATPGGVAGLIVLGLLVVALVVVVRLRVGKMSRPATARRGAVFTGAPVTADDHRSAAAEAWARGALDDVVRERFRAVVRDLEERGVLEPRAGRTADEAAIEAGAQVPAATDELRAAAARFDDVHYGGGSATEADCERLARLDAVLRGGRRVAR